MGRVQWLAKWFLEREPSPAFSWEEVAAGSYCHIHINSKRVYRGRNPQYLSALHRADLTVRNRDRLQMLARFPELTTPLAFCDLNFIVTAHQGADAYKDHLRQLAGSEPSHSCCRLCTGLRQLRTLIRLVAQPRPTSWMVCKPAGFYKRRSVQGKETAAAFFRFLGIQGNPSQMGVRSSHRVTSLQPPTSGIKSTVPEEAHA